MAASDEPLAKDRLRARDDLSSVEHARQVAVERTRRPAWLLAAFAIAVGVAFGFAMLRSPWGWTVGLVLFVLTIVLFLVVDSRLRRRRGRLLDTGFRAGNALRFLAVYAAIFILGMIQPPPDWQPWFAIASGAVVAVLGYTYLRRDDAATAKRLATGDFDPGDLMP